MFGADEYDAETLRGGLGTDYEILHVGFKPYSCCRILQSAVEAAGKARAQGNIDIPGDIETIRLSVAPIVCTWPFSNRRPTNLWAAQFSAPYVVAMALMGVPPGPGWFSEEKLSDAAVQALMDRIELHEIDRLPPILVRTISRLRRRSTRVAAIRCVRLSGLRRARQQIR